MSNTGIPLYEVDALFSQRLVVYPAVNEYLPRRESAVGSLEGQTFLFGGDSEAGPCGDLHVYDRGAEEWRMMYVEGIKPKARYGHTIVAYNGFLYVFGGKDDHTWFTDLWELDPLAVFWRRNQPQSLSVPQGRIGHVSVLDETRQTMIMHGGMCSTHQLNDVWSYHYPSSWWTEEIPDERLGLANSIHSSSEFKRDEKWNGEDVAGEGGTAVALAPHSRVWHVGCVWKDQLMIFGGRSQSPAITFGDTWALNLKTRVWGLVQPAGTPPSPRYGHVGVLIHDRWLLHGGRCSSRSQNVSTGSLYELHLSQGIWSEVELPAASPSLPRLAWHSGCVVKLGGNRQAIVVTAGADEADRVTNSTLWLHVGGGGGVGDRLKSSPESSRQISPRKSDLPPAAPPLSPVLPGLREQSSIEETDLVVSKAARAADAAPYTLIEDSRHHLSDQANYFIRPPQSSNTLLSVSSRPSKKSWRDKISEDRMRKTRDWRSHNHDITIAHELSITPYRAAVAPVGPSNVALPTSVELPQDKVYPLRDIGKERSNSLLQNTLPELKPGVGVETELAHPHPTTMPGASFSPITPLAHKAIQQVGRQVDPDGDTQPHKLVVTPSPSASFRFLPETPSPSQGSTHSPKASHSLSFSAPTFAPYNSWRSREFFSITPSNVTLPSGAYGLTPPERDVGDDDNPGSEVFVTCLHHRGCQISQPF
eukprot:GHVN01014444.1.p1 GENE.GHVN01014444.1~~GHVN01014444.1.p1  ORF type:complete len:703 (-),score=59.25 GHVN01014444.1:159-2267(-)